MEELRVSICKVRRATIVMVILITVFGYLFPRHLLCGQQWHRAVSHRRDHRRENGEHTGQSSTDGCSSWPGSLCQHCQVRNLFAIGYPAVFIAKGHADPELDYILLSHVRAHYRQVSQDNTLLSIDRWSKTPLSTDRWVNTLLSTDRWRYTLLSTDRWVNTAIHGQMMQYTAIHGQVTQHSAIHWQVS